MKDLGLIKISGFFFSFEEPQIVRQLLSLLENIFVACCYVEYYLSCPHANLISNLFFVIFSLQVNVMEYDVQ